jgi:hypothetical protein
MAVDPLAQFSAKSATRILEPMDRISAHAYAELLGGWAVLSDTMAANVRRAAELVALAENARADALRNGNTDALGLVRLEGAANRAVRALQLDRKKREPGAASSLSEYLRHRP